MFQWRKENEGNFRLTLHHHLLFLSYYYYFYYIGMSLWSESVHGGPILRLPTWLLCSVKFSYSLPHTHCHAFVCHCEDWFNIMALVLLKKGKQTHHFQSMSLKWSTTLYWQMKSELKFELSLVRLSEFYKFFWMCTILIDVLLLFTLWHHFHLSTNRPVCKLSCGNVQWGYLQIWRP